MIVTYDSFYVRIAINVWINEIASLSIRLNNTNLLPTHAKIKDTPSYSLGSRPKDAKIYVTPAPGAYESCDTNQYKGKSPAFSLSTRYVIPSDVAMKPGPGAYTPEKVRFTITNQLMSFWHLLFLQTNKFPHRYTNIINILDRYKNSSTAI